MGVIALAQMFIRGTFPLEAAFLDRFLQDDEIDLHNVSIRQGLLFMDIYSIRFVILVHT